MDHACESPESENAVGGNTGEEVDPPPFHVFEFIFGAIESHAKVHEKYAAGDIIGDDYESVYFRGKCDHSVDDQNTDYIEGEYEYQKIKKAEAIVNIVTGNTN